MHWLRSLLRHQELHADYTDVDNWLRFSAFQFHLCLQWPYVRPCPGPPCRALARTASGLTTPAPSPVPGPIAILIKFNSCIASPSNWFLPSSTIVCVHLGSFKHAGNGLMTVRNDILYLCIVQCSTALLSDAVFKLREATPAWARLYLRALFALFFFFFFSLPLSLFLSRSLSLSHSLCLSLSLYLSISLLLSSLLY